MLRQVLSRWLTRTRKRPTAIKVRPAFETLEDRINPTTFSTSLRAAITSDSISIDFAAIIRQQQIPVLHSNPTASIKVYLEFNGYSGNWWHYQDDGTKSKTYSAATPVFDMDGNKSTFSATEIDQMKKIWSAVAEDYAPFNVDITTEDPGDFTNGKAIRVAIGGSNWDWLNLACSGISSIGSFSNAAPNTVFVFTEAVKLDVSGVDHQLKAIATTISHESGHAFGLVHQKQILPDGSLNNYNPGTSTWTPIMGDNESWDRTTWSNGIIDASSNTQDELAVLAGVLGYRRDDHGNKYTTADALQPGITLVASPNGVTSGSLAGVVGNNFKFVDQFTGTGILERMSDRDFYSFDLSVKSDLNIAVNGIGFGSNLSARVELYNSAGKLISSSDNADWPTLTRNAVGAGRYYVCVSSQGQYGDLGQYTVYVTRRDANPFRDVAILTAPLVILPDPGPIHPPGPVEIVTQPAAAVTNPVLSASTSYVSLVSTTSVKTTNILATDAVFSALASPKLSSRSLLLM